MRSFFVKLFAIFIEIALIVMAVELILRTWPVLFPKSFLEELPFIGADLFVPGILERTPIDAVPIPYFSAPVYGRPGAASIPFSTYLRDIGLVPQRVHPNAPVIYDVSVKIDSQGFGNPTDVDQADIVLIGDSYTFTAAVLEPPGLQARLRRETAATVYNLAVPAIGPLRELWLLKHVGLPKQPKAVLWFFFPFNDLDDLQRLLTHQQQGIETYADLADLPDMRELYSLKLMRFLLDGSKPGSPERRREPVPEFLVSGPGAATSAMAQPLPGIALNTGADPVEMWFYPQYLRDLTRTGREWENHPAWGPAQEVIREAHRATVAAGAAFLLVYVPSKPEVYLPFVAGDAGRLFSMAFFDTDTDPGYRSAGEFLEQALQNGDGLEALVQGFCETNGIPFLSYLPALRRQYRNGVLGYPPADTHWVPAGQAAALPELFEWLDHAGIPTMVTPSE